MKKLSLLLCVLLVLSLLCSCQKTDQDNKSDKTNVTNKTSDSANPNQPQEGDTTTATNSNGSVEGEYDNDILKGLPYTIECREYYMPDEVVDYNFTDEGRLNDGLYRSQAQLENGTGQDKQVVLSDIRRYRVQITFESDGTQTGSCLVLQNCDTTYFLELEVGPDLDNLTTLEVEEDYEAPTGMHITQLIRFEPTHIQTVRITLYTSSRSDIALDEIAILSPTNGGDSWTTTPTEPTNNNDNTTGTTSTTSPTTPTNTTSTTGTRPTGNVNNSIVGRWTQHVEGDNVEMTALYSFFDDGTGSLITFGGLVTGEITYTYGENNRYNIAIKAKLFGQEDSDTGSGYMYVEGDYLYVITDEDETTVLRRMTDEECGLALELAEKVGIRF